MSTAGVTTTEHREASRSGLRVWPLRRPAVWVLLKGAGLLLALWSAFGLLFVHVFEDGPAGDADRAISRWFEEQRTPTVNSLSHWGSMLAETPVKLGLVFLAGTAMVVVWRRWHDAVLLAVAVLFEATVFVITSFIVGRERPPVPKLDPVPPSGSFPSGHTGAAAAFYGALFVIVCWHTRNRAVRSIFAVLAVVVPVIVALSRVARGMHHALDVSAGLALGIASVFVVRAALRAGVDDIDRRADASVPEHVRHLDLTVAHGDSAHGDSTTHGDSAHGDSTGDGDSIDPGDGAGPDRPSVGQRGGNR